MSWEYWERRHGQENRARRDMRRIWRPRGWDLAFMHSTEAFFGLSLSWSPFFYAKPIHEKKKSGFDLFWH